MNLATLPPRRNQVSPQPMGVDRMLNFQNGLKKLEEMPNEYSILREIQAKLSGLGEPPQFGNRATLKDIQNAIRMAELGETYYMYAFFRDMTQNDAHLQAEIGKRVMSFMGQVENIEPMDPKSADDKIAVEVIEDMRENCENWDEGSVHLALGHIWPVSGAEKIFMPAAEFADASDFRHPVVWGLHKIHPIPWPLYTYKVAYWNVGQIGGSPQELMTQQGAQLGTGSVPINNPAGIVAYQPTGQGVNDVFVWNPQDWHPDLRFYGTLPNGIIDWTLSTGYKPNKLHHVLHSAQVATSGMRDNFGATMRALIPLWFYKRNLLDWYMQSMERYGAPFVVANAQMQNKSVSDVLTKAFNQASVLRALLVPTGVKVQLEQAQTSGMSDGFAKAIEVLNMEETKAVLGITMATSNKGNGLSGGSGQADLQGDVKEEWSMFDRRKYCTMQRKQIFNQYLRMNGYKGRVRAVRGGISAQQQALVAKTYLQLYQSGWRVTEDDAQKMSNIFGMKLERFDPIAEQAKAQPLNGDAIPKDKSK
jgi:hypothetical protein